jgi:hypothetical protein
LGDLVLFCGEEERSAGSSKELFAVTNAFLTFADPVNFISQKLSREELALE